MGKVVAAATSQDGPAPDIMPRPGVTEAIVRSIQRGIYEGRYVPGQRLCEADLTRALQVSRGPVREALRRLEADGIVEMRLNSGARIRRLSNDDVRDFLEMMEMLSGLAARLCAQKGIDSAALTRLDDILQEGAALHDGGDFFGAARCRDHFYALLTRASGNQELAKAMSRLQPHLIRAQFTTSRTRPYAANVKDYQMVLDAVAARTPDRAECLMRDHIRMSAQAILADID